MEDKKSPATPAGVHSAHFTRDSLSHLPDTWRYAMAYARQGWSVFPCYKKNPITQHGFLNSTTDIDQITEWSRRYPTANIGVATGTKSGFFVVDADDPDAVDALIAQELICKTVTSQTGRGRHYWFRMPEDMDISCKTKLLPKVDIRANGGYIIAPPSLHANGRRYEFVISPKDAEIAEPPAKLLELIFRAKSQTPHEPSGSSSQTISELREIARGGLREGLDSRNESATRLFGHLLRHYVDVYVAASLMELWDRTNQPPLGSRELSKIIESVSGIELRRRQRGGTAS